MSIINDIFKFLDETPKWEMFPGADKLARQLLSEEQRLENELAALRNCAAYVRMVSERLDPEVIACKRLIDNLDQFKKPSDP